MAADVETERSKGKEAEAVAALEVGSPAAEGVAAPASARICAGSNEEDDECFAALNVNRNVVDHGTIPESSHQIGNFDDWVRHDQNDE